MFYKMTINWKKYAKNHMFLIIFPRYTALFTLNELDVRSNISYFHEIRWRQTNGRQICHPFSKLTAFSLTHFSCILTHIKCILIQGYVFYIMFFVAHSTCRSFRSENLCLRRFHFRHGNKAKSTGARSGLYGGGGSALRSQSPVNRCPAWLIVQGFVLMKYYGP